MGSSASFEREVAPSVSAGLTHRTGTRVFSTSSCARLPNRCEAPPADDRARDPDAPGGGRPCDLRSDPRALGGGGRVRGPELRGRGHARGRGGDDAHLPLSPRLLGDPGAADRFGSGAHGRGGTGGGPERAAAGGGGGADRSRAAARGSRGPLARRG